MEKEKYVAPKAIVSDIKTSKSFLQMDSGDATINPTDPPEDGGGGTTF